MKKNPRQISLGLLFLIAGSTAFSAAAFAANPGAYYTKTNVWYEKPKKILSTNYHKGVMIPAGTEVEVISNSRKKIKFREKPSGIAFTVKLIKKFTNLNADEFFDRYFSKENVLSGSQYNSFSAMEKENIKAGTIKEDMSKEAVLMAYGYPPTHRTPSTSDNTWTYWKSRLGNFSVQFKDNKVVSAGL